MKTVLIILGYKLNSDNTAHPLLIKRLNMAIRLIAELLPERVILSGGIPYPEINNTSEAQVMFDYLVARGISPNLLVKEEKSVSTRENALYSVPLAKEVGANNILVISTIEHFTEYPYNVLKIFADRIQDKNVYLSCFTDTIPEHTAENPVKQ